MIEYDVIEFSEAMDVLERLSPESIASVVPETLSKRQKERLMTLALVKRHFGADAETGHNPDGAPFVTTSASTFISLTHSGNRAAMAFSATLPVGIDLQDPSPALMRVRERFLTEEQLPVWGKDEDTLLQAWTIKEAVYKAAGIKPLTSDEIHISPDGKTASAEHQGFTARYKLSYPLKGLTVCSLITD